MLTIRREAILKSIVEQYITRAKPVSSQSIIVDYGLEVSSATIRNEMMRLEEEGYILRPHTSSGSVPSDKGYRHHVKTMGTARLTPAEQQMISHLFHQVEEELEEWLNLAAALIAQMVRNAVVVTTPKPDACQFKHLELVHLQESTTLLILVLSGAKIREQLIAFDQMVTQSELTILANKLTALYTGLTSLQILTKGARLAITEQEIVDCVVKLMETEDEQEYEPPYLDGLHYALSQPEFTHNYRMALTLMELIEQKALLRSIIPLEPASQGVRVIIGKENKTESIRDYSVVISQYGLPEAATGTIGVIGPTRMPYARTIATVDYLASVLSQLMAKLYGR